MLSLGVILPPLTIDPETSIVALLSTCSTDAALTDLAAMGAGVSTDGMRVAGVPVGVDAWVKTFVEKKARSVITDASKLDVDKIGTEAF